MAVMQVQSVLSVDYCWKICKDSKRCTADRFVNVYTKCIRFMMCKCRKSESRKYVEDYLTMSGKSASVMVDTEFRRRSHTSMYSGNRLGSMNWLKFGDKIQLDTIHDHTYQKKISMQVWSAIMGRNCRVVLGHTSKWCLERIFFTQVLQFITHLLFGPVQPSPVLWYKVTVFTNVNKADVQKGLQHTSHSQGPKFIYDMQ